MEYTKKLKGHACDIEMKGRFTNDDTAIMQHILSYLNDNEVTHLCIDMSNLDFIDSAALGQLLALRENLIKRVGGVTIKGAQGYVKEMLNISNFEQIFNIEE